MQRRSIEICRVIGNPNSERYAQVDLARTYRAVGRPDLAASGCERALSIARELGEPHGEGIALWELGNAGWDLGEHGRASSCWWDALVLPKAIQAPEAAEVRTPLATTGSASSTPSTTDHDEITQIRRAPEPQVSAVPSTPWQFDCSRTRRERTSTILDALGRQAARLVAPWRHAPREWRATARNRSQQTEWDLPLN